jgi:hypothetical protein
MDGDRHVGAPENQGPALYERNGAFVNPVPPFLSAVQKGYSVAGAFVFISHEVGEKGFIRVFANGE